jgi:hypothetical protein
MVRYVIVVPLDFNEIHIIKFIMLINIKARKSGQL